MSRRKKFVLGSLALLLAGAGLFVEYAMGWSNVIGMLRYDTRREGALKVGDVAPNVALHALEDGRVRQLFEHPLTRPVVLVFGSFT